MRPGSLEGVPNARITTLSLPVPILAVEHRPWRNRCRYRPDRPSIGPMSLLNTAQGPINTADIGVTLMHEHVFIMTTEIAQNYPEAWGDEDARVADAVTRLNELKSRGVDTIVDLTVIGL